MEESDSSNEGTPMSTSPHQATATPVPTSDTESTSIRPARPTRTEWAHIAIFAIPYGVLIPTQLIHVLIPQGSPNFVVLQDVLNMGLLVLVLAFFGREFLSSFSYMSTRPLRKVAAIIGMVALTIVAQNLARAAIATQNSAGSEDLHYLTEGVAGLVFSFIVALGGPLIEEVFFRHILIGKLSTYAPTWLVATISCLLFTAMHCHGWQDIASYIPIALVLTLAYVCSGKNLACSWLVHALNNSIIVGAVFLTHGLGTGA